MFCWESKDNKIQIKDHQKILEFLLHFLFRYVSIVFRGSILCNAISDEIKSSQSIASFKHKIKSWNGDDCNCNICN